MTKTIAIAALAVRATIRSRFFVTLSVILLFVIFALPLTIKGDGTAAGLVKILLCYTLGLSSVILGIATLWTSCAAISSEIEEKQIQLSVTKPVHRFQIWIGKWLGILAVNSVLLLIAGITIYGYVHHYSVSAGLTEKDRNALENELLIGRRLIVPEEEQIDRTSSEVRTRLEQLGHDKELDPKLTADEVFALVRKEMIFERRIVVPGQSKRWQFEGFPSAGGMGVEHAAAIRFNFTLTFGDRKRVSGTWLVSGKDGKETFRFDMKDWPDGMHTISMPVSAIPRGPFTVTFENAGRARSNTAVFDSEGAVQVLVPESTFAPNLARSLIVILCQLGLIAAIGLAAGSLFSFPVATFAAASIIVIAMAGHYFAMASSPKYAVEEDHHGDEQDKLSIIETVSENAVRRMEVVIAPVMEMAPLDFLSDGILVSWRFTGRAVLLLLIVYPAFFLVFGNYFLNRRELALPST
jgi:ABC-type transport system involved in multi-copper enzyme maturation permease subunit